MPRTCATPAHFHANDAHQISSVSSQLPAHATVLLDRLRIGHLQALTVPAVSALPARRVSASLLIQHEPVDTREAARPCMRSIACAARRGVPLEALCKPGVHAADCSPMPTQAARPAALPAQVLACAVTAVVSSPQHPFLVLCPLTDDSMVLLSESGAKLNSKAQPASTPNLHSVK